MVWGDMRTRAVADRAPRPAEPGVAATCTWREREIWRLRFGRFSAFWFTPLGDETEDGPG